MAEGNDWFLVEAECSDQEDETVETCIEDFFDASDLIDDAQVDQGNSLVLFQEQESEQHSKRVHDIKRKLNLSPEMVNAQLSPRLNAVQLSSHSGSVRKKLFTQDDSGIQSPENETPVLARAECEVETDRVRASTSSASSFCKVLLNASNQRACALGQYKTVTGVGFKELTRDYKSNKTMNTEWLIGILDLPRATAETMKEWLPNTTDFFLWHYDGTDRDTCCTVLTKFKAQKCKETILKMLNSHYRFATPNQVLLDPPKMSSPACALYFYKLSTYPSAFKHGEFPDWVLREISVTHRLAAEKPFCMTEMVQWAYDNELVDECNIAYKYAALAEENENAMAFLNSNSQAKIVKDVTYMVRMYRRAEQRAMSVSEYTYKCLGKLPDTGDWKIINAFLRYQGVNFFHFIAALKKLFAKVPKHSCMVFYGPSDTGKSVFATSFIKAVEGKVLSFQSNASHFWLSPLVDAKFAMMDDVTVPGWNYIDSFLRNAFDGATVSIDCKHRQPQQVPCPPIICTTNVDVKADARWRHLSTRLTVFNFPNPFPFEGGKPVYDITPETWKAFLTKFWSNLDLSDHEDDSDGENQPTLRLCTRKTAQDL